jgi:hypothetical protein
MKILLVKRDLALVIKRSGLPNDHSSEWMPASTMAYFQVKPSFKCLHCLYFFRSFLQL